MESIAKSQVSETLMQHKAWLLIFGLIAVLLLVLKISNCNSKQRLSSVVVSKPMGLKNIVDLKLKKALEKIHTDVKCFKGLKQSEVEAITLRNTQLNSGTKRNSSKSLSNIRIDKLDGTRRKSSGFKSQAFSHSFEDLRSLSTFSSLNSEEELADLHVEIIPVNPINTKEAKDSKRVSFVW